MLKNICVLSVFCVLYVDALKLPDYFTKCDKNDPKIDECIVESGNKGLPEMLKGDKKYKLPNMLPFKINSIVIEPSSNLALTISNADVHGLEGTKIIQVKSDQVNKKMEMLATVPKLQVIGEYEIKGKIMILPISGKGPANITLVGGTYKYSMHYGTKTVKDVEYYEIIDKDCDFEIEKAYFDLQNLFNGDARLGPQMNEMLNENWKEVNGELKPGVNAAMSAIITSIVNHILEHVPAEDIF